jgi:hypothetical protein
MDFNPPLEALNFNHQHDSLEKIQEITIEEFESNLKTSNKKSAPGSDEITFQMINNCPQHIKNTIIKFFNFSIRNGQMPAQWKTAKIKMISKPGKNT